MRSVAFLTYEKRPELQDDDALCVPLLKEHGIAVEAHPWDSDRVDWKKFDAIILRSTWDYYLRQTEFLERIASFERAGVRVYNSGDILRWNTNKTYLRELEQKGVAIVPTQWIDNAKSELPDFERLGWDEVVLKPAIGAGGFDTSRHEARDRASIKSALARIQGRGPILAQPFLKEILTNGELSFFFFNEKFSHAVAKKPASGNFLVQSEHGGTSAEFKPTPEQLAAAQRVIAAAPKPLLYARVDMIAARGELFLGELEITEPSLFLDRAAIAPTNFADAIAHVLQKD